MSKAISSIALLGIGAFAAYYLYTSQKYGHSPSTAKGVTNSTKGGVNSSPVQGRRVAAVGLADPRSWLGTVTNRAASLIPSNLSNGSVAQDWRIPFGNPESAVAASNAVKATNVSNYRPSSWSAVAQKFRSGV